MSLDGGFWGGRLCLRHPWLLWTHEEPQVESSEHQDNANIHYQPFPESVSEEREIHADYNGCHHHHVNHYNYSSIHSGSSGFKSIMTR
jgi:hypothetical protein